MLKLLKSRWLRIYIFGGTTAAYVSAVKLESLSDELLWKQENSFKKGQFHQQMRRLSGIKVSLKENTKSSQVETTHRTGRNAGSSAHHSGIVTVLWNFELIKKS